MNCVKSSKYLEYLGLTPDRAKQMGEGEALNPETLVGVGWRLGITL